MTTRPWRQEGFGDAYRPSTDPMTGKKVIRRVELSSRATQEVFDLYDPADDEAYLLVGFDGMLRDGGHLYQLLDNALNEAMEHNFVLFYAKTGSAYRVVWKQEQLPQRTLDNYNLEDVLLNPDILALGDEVLTNNKKVRSVFKGLK